MTPTPSNLCQCCGQRLSKLNKHVMDRQKVALLELLAKHGGWVGIQQGSGADVDGTRIRAPYCAAAHASRLVWFGLAERQLERRSGKYRVTASGEAFLRGLHLVPKSIWCRKGQVIERDSVMVGVGSIKGVVLDKEYWDSYPVHGQK